MNNNYIKVLIKGHNVNNYLKWLIKEKINILNINIINHHELFITIDYKDYQILSKYSKTYEIKIIKKYGRLRIIDIIKKNIVIIVSLIFSIFFLYFLSNLIFTIEVVSNDKEMVDLLKKELASNDVKKYHLKKNYQELQLIKKNILENNKDIIEWLEITSNGTKYIVKYVERKQKNTENTYNYQSISATKDAIITDIRAYNGEKIKNVNDYVQKNEIVISGIIEKPNGTKIYNKAIGKIYGEVWYKITVDHPYTYYEEKITGNHKNVLSFNILNHEYHLIPYKKYINFKKNINSILKEQLSLFSLSYETEYEVLITEDIYTQEEVIDLAKKKAKEKLIESNNKIIEIKDISILNKTDLGSKLKIELFVVAIEDITKIVEITKEKIEETPKDNIVN